MLNFAFSDVQSERWFVCRGCSTPFEKDGVFDDCLIDLAFELFDGYQQEQKPPDTTSTSGGVGGRGQ